jgi:hypothetical protein
MSDHKTALASLCGEWNVNRQEQRTLLALASMPTEDILRLARQAIRLKAAECQESGDMGGADTLAAVAESVGEAVYTLRAMSEACPDMSDVDGDERERDYCR